MKSRQDTQAVASANIKRPQGAVLKGQYIDVLRSQKGKLKGIVLRTADGTYSIKLPKYLRPVLVRELAPHAFVQVWAYPDEGDWRGINLMPLEEADAIALRDIWADLNGATQTTEAAVPTPKPQPASNKLCVHVCRKGKCFKQGGAKLLKTLQTEVATNPELAHVTVEGVGCMKECKRGPNLKFSNSKKVINGVTAESALSLITAKALL